MVKLPPLWHLESSEMCWIYSRATSLLWRCSCKLPTWTTLGWIALTLQAWKEAPKIPRGFLAAHNSVYLVLPATPEPPKCPRKALSVFIHSELICPYHRNPPWSSRWSALEQAPGVCKMTLSEWDQVKQFVAYELKGERKKEHRARGETGFIKLSCFPS